MSTPHLGAKKDEIAESILLPGDPLRAKFIADTFLEDVVIAMSASTDSSVNKLRFGGMDFAPTADFDLLRRAWEKAAGLGISVKVGNVLTSDTFYNDDPEGWKLWAEYGVLTAEMETAALYTLAAKFKVKALSLLTVSDSIVTHEACSAEERQTTFKQMIEVALEIV